MPSTEDRIKTLINENLKVDGQPLNLPEDLEYPPHYARRVLFGCRRVRESGCSGVQRDVDTRRLCEG